VERHLSVACVTSGIIDQYVLHVWLRVDWSGVRGGVRILVQDWVHLFAGEVKVRCHGLRRVLWAQALISCERGVILILLQIMGLLMSRLYLGLIRLCISAWALLLPTRGCLLAWSIAITCFQNIIDVYLLRGIGNPGHCALPGCRVSRIVEVCTGIYLGRTNLLLVRYNAQVLTRMVA